MNNGIRTIDEYYSRIDSNRTMDEFQKRRNIANANYIVFAGSPVYHTLDETSNPMCGTETGDAWKLELVDEPPDFLRPCKNCERIMNSGKSPDAIRRKKNAEWFRSVL